MNKCPVAKKCSGCQLQNLTYEEQLKFKQGTCEKFLSKFGTVNEITGMYFPYHYRNKVQSYFIQSKGGKIVSGVYQSKTKGIASVDSCLIEDKKADEIVVTIRNLMKSLKLTAYDRTNDAGFMRHVLIRRAFKTGQIMVVLAASTPLFPNKNVFVKELVKAHPEITTIVHNIADDKTETMVLGEREIVLYGNGYIEDVLCGCRFRISPKSFYQINPLQTEVLYKKAMEYAGLTGKELVLDMYCGIGTIGLIAAKNAGKVISVEINKQAVRDAITNAKLNNVKNVRFFNDDATDFMTNMANEGVKADVLFMDPPRAGSTKEFIEAAVKLAPSRIVYISCNPETQEKDLLRLTKNGYSVKKIQPVDMFPHTKSVEVVSLLTRR